jgi:hypothetical protein
MPPIVENALDRIVKARIICRLVGKSLRSSAPALRQKSPPAVLDKLVNFGIIDCAK